MNRSNPFRLAYRLILYLHPAPFRRRFGAEMQWIFDEETSRGATARLLFDGLISLVRQHSQPQKELAPAVAGFAFIDTGLSISPRRFLEAGITASLLLAGFMLLLGSRHTPPPLPICLPGTPHTAPRTLQAPSRIRPLPKSPLPPPKQFDHGHIDNAVGSAIRIAHAQDLASATDSRYCTKN